MNEKLATQYDGFSEAFAAAVEDDGAYSRGVFYEMLEADLQGKDLLDLACGDGIDIEEYRRRGARCVGVDASEEMLALAKKRLQDVTLSLGEFERIPFPDASFDIVVSKYAIQTMPDIQATYAEVARVLKPGGRFIFLTVHPLRQFIERKEAGTDYFAQKVVDSVLFGGRVVAKEPTHTFQEYLSTGFFERFSLEAYLEDVDFPSAERIGGMNYPAFMILSATRR